MTDDRLDEESGERRCYPQCRQGVQARSERLEDAAHVRGLKCKSDLDSEKSEGEIPQRRSRLSRLLDDFRTIHSCPPLPPANECGRCSDIREGSYRSAREI